MSTPNKNFFVIVIGETGAGKSTFINYVANALHKKATLDTLQVVIPNEHYSSSAQYKSKHSERALDDSTLSKTAECQPYTFPLSSGKGSLVLIDTPGLSDTSGYLKDNQNVNMIFQTIKALEYISGIILVINGTTTRMTSNVTNVLTRFQQFSPDSIYTNMIVVLTNCQSYNVSFDKSSLNLPSTCPFFCMQNSAYCKPLDAIKAYRTSLESEFKESIKTINDIIKHIQKLQPRLTKAFADLNDERYRLQAFLHEAHLMILEMEQVENELENLKIAADFGKTNVENLLQRKKIFVSAIVPKDHCNVICMQCDNVCHKNCELNEKPLTGHYPLSKCSQMRNGQCTKCQCSIERHYYGYKDIKKGTQSIIGSMNRAEERLRSEQEDHALTIGRYNSVETTKTEVQNLLDRQCDRIRQTCINLKKSCQSTNIAQELFDFVQILNRDRQKLQSPLVINRLGKLVDELERIASDYQKTEESVGDNKLHSNTHIQSSVEASPLVPVRQKHRRQTSVATPSFYQPDSKSDLNSPSQPTQQPSKQSPLYSAYSTERLIGAHRELIRWNPEHAKRTLLELQKRAKGSSVGFLNRCELAQFADHYADWRHHDKNYLQEEYDNLAERIDADINWHTCDLEHVVTDDLLKIAALSLLINSIARV